jgi:hypothetical protein
MTSRGTLRQVFICRRPPPLLGFCLGWSSNFVGSQSGQIQSDKLPQNMVSNRTPTQHPLPPPSHKLSVQHVMYFVTEKGGGGVELNQSEG